MSKLGIPILDSFPLLKQLGQPKVQSLCDSWTQTPRARECAISSMKVAAAGSQLLLGFDLQVSHRAEDQEEYFFPMDDLIIYIVEHAGFDASTRDQLKADIIENRRRIGPDRYQRFRLQAGPMLPRYLRGAPHSRFSRDIRRMSACTWRSTRGRTFPTPRDFQHQTTAEQQKQNTLT